MNKQKNLIIFNQFETIVGKIHSISYPNRQGATSEVAFFHTDSGQFVCKNAKTSKYREWLSTEAQVMKRLNEETALPIPTIYEFVEEENVSHLLMSLEKGVTLRDALQQADSEERCSLFESFGELLKQLHETMPPQSWTTDKTWLENQLEKATYNLKNYQVDRDQILLDNLKKHKPTATKQTLIHGDCTIDNVLVSNGKVHTFIDLAGAAYGDPRYDIALALRSVRNNAVMLKAFYKGYERQVITEDEFDYFDGGLYEFF
ncbi:aminoglycoside phosphotransferase family protein [Psychrobacillus sp. NPDC096426]|uniref:aminoglycoside phosphotransferase family protein n=1 Tax=Psychrobacillus sp. NPDC096426 TaxID=3364491 RepID=UPI0037F1DD6A